MNEFKPLIISVGSAVGTAIVAYIAAIIRNKMVNSTAKVQRPMLEAVENYLGGDYLLPFLRNTYQCYVKNLKRLGTWSLENHERAIDKTYQAVLIDMPKYIIKMAKRVYTSVELKIKEKLQNYYEANKNKINIEVK